MNKFIEKYWWIFGILIVGLPLAPMANLHASFDGDWYIHLWFARYYSAYLKFHHVLPLEVNSNEVIGLPINLFYGYILEPVFGLLTVLAGPQIAARLIIFGAGYLQFQLVFRLILKLSREKLASLVVATLVLWAVYPYTVVFTEAAIPEYTATTLIVCGFCAWFISFLSETTRERLVYALLCALTLALALGTHPITALYSSFFLGIVFGFCLIFVPRPKSLFKAGLVKNTFFNNVLVTGRLFVFLLIFLSPWIYVNLNFVNKMVISKEPALGFLFDSADTWWTRFQLFPFDKRSLLHGQDVNTCYLDAQMNMALLIFMAGNKLVTLALGLFLLTSWMSLSEIPYNFVPKQFKLVQFGMRLITYQNLSLLLLIVAFLLKDQRFLSSKKNPAHIALTAVALTLAFMNTIERDAHSMGARNPAHNPTFDFEAPVDTAFITLPSWLFYSAYLIPSPADSLKIDPSQITELKLKVGLDQDFGKPLPTRLVVEKSGWVSTNVASFDWNKLYVDNRLMEGEQIQIRGNFLVVRMAAGTHLVSTAFEAPRTLTILRTASFSIFILCIVSLVFYGFSPGFFRRKSSWL